MMRYEISEQSCNFVLNLGKIGAFFFKNNKIKMVKKKKYGVTNLEPLEYVAQIRTIFREKGNVESSEKYRNYMKQRVDFFGLTAPVWVALSKDFFEKNGVPVTQNMWEVVRICFAEECREMHYFALEIVQNEIERNPDASPDLIELLEELVLTQSWWDTVDWLAKLIALHFQRFTHQENPKTWEWIEHEDMWLQRIAVTYQRYYKVKTDEEKLFAFVLKIAHSREFFLQKGAGWALREYARWNAEAVKDFVATHYDKLAPLTRREALRHFQK
ncbi:MAG: hypothetical protein RL757_2896 [Bacteroidota bacterium]|jgi:3-methyladenine DNA glycosylase AlkD